MTCVIYSWTVGRDGNMEPEVSSILVWFNQWRAEIVATEDEAERLQERMIISL